jgi:hypothetical protein
MNMKTWTNPSVEELDVKLTASWNWFDVSEEPDLGNGEYNGPWGSEEDNGGSSSENGNGGNSEVPGTGRGPES